MRKGIAGLTIGIGIVLVLALIFGGAYLVDKYGETIFALIQLLFFGAGALLGYDLFTKRSKDNSVPLMASGVIGMIVYAFSGAILAVSFVLAVGVLLIYGFVRFILKRG